MTHKRNSFGLFSALFIAGALLCGPETFANNTENTKQYQENHTELSYVQDNAYVAQCCHSKKSEEKACDKKKKKKKGDDKS